MRGRTLFGALSVAALVWAGLLQATPADAAVDGDLTWTIKDHAIALTSPDEGRLSLQYRCGTVTQPRSNTVSLGIYQPDRSAPTAVAYDAQESPNLTCDGQERSLSYLFFTSSGHFTDGAARVALVQYHFEQGLDATYSYEDVVLRLPGSEVKDVVALTLDAHPEPTRKGSKTTVDGKVTRNGKAFPRAEVRLEFASEGGAFHKLSTVRANSKGKLSVKVKARTSGSYRFTVPETEKIGRAVSAEDFVVVIPKARSYKRCSTLNKVYPHGVAKKASVKDRGTAVTGFTVDKTTYKKNKKLDKDKDGIACEKA